VISGFNTDVECAGIVYHVQTEDKGAPHNVIMSLVYDKGTILASKREPYDDDTASGQLKDRVNKQHKLICAAVKAGRIDDLKQMTAANRNGSSNGKSKERSTDPLLPRDREAHRSDNPDRGAGTLSARGSGKNVFDHNRGSRCS